MKKSGFFWVSYADLMTSLFFIMLVLYVITFSILQSQQGTLKAKEKQLEAIKNVQKAIENIDPTYYQFDKENKRYKLNIDVQFQPNSSKITDIPLEKREELKKAGENLYTKIKSIVDTTSTIDYLLIIEGNTQRYNDNWKTNPDAGYIKSYERALSLYTFWQESGYDFGDLGSQCEVIIAGSGYFSQSRDLNNENNNRRFSIQVTSKVGKFLIDEKNPLKKIKEKKNIGFFKKLFTSKK